MKHLLQKKGGVFFCFCFTLLIAADVQAQVCSLLNSSSTNLLGHATFMAWLGSQGAKWPYTGYIKETIRKPHSGIATGNYIFPQIHLKAAQTTAPIPLTGRSLILPNSWNLDNQNLKTYGIILLPFNQYTTLVNKSVNQDHERTGFTINSNIEASSDNLTMASGRPDADLKDMDAGASDTPFTRCKNNTTDIKYKVNIKNNSGSKSINKSYRIEWGDNEEEEFDSSFDVASHTYTRLGVFDMILTVTGKDGSTSHKRFKVYNGRTPNLTMGSPDHTGGCAPQTYVFPIGGVANNPAGTKYTFTFNDGTPPLVYTQENVPSSITHVFTQSSCGKAGDTFTLVGRAENPCGSTEVTVLSRKIGAKPTVNFAVDNNNIVCTDTDVSIRNTTINSNSITNSGDCSPLSIFNWKIEPASGWTLTSGTNTSQDISIRFSAAGTYRITLTGGNDCGVDEITQEVTVVPPPKAAFSINQAGDCKTNTVTTTNSSEGNNLTYSWNINPNSGYTLLSGTLTSPNPVFQFTEAGKYTIALNASSGCKTSTATQEISLKGAPMVSLPKAQVYCGPQSIKFDAANNAHQPVIDDNNSTISAFTWSVTGNATFVAPTNQHSRYPQIDFPAVGTYTVSLKAVNECGESVTATQVVTIDNTTTVGNIANTIGQDQKVCQGATVSISAGTTPAQDSGTYTYLWESSTTSATTGFSPADGLNTGTSYTSGALAQTTWFRRKIFIGAGACTFNTSNTVKVEVAPVVSSNIIKGVQSICGGESPTKLTGSDPSGGQDNNSFTYLWEYSTTDAHTNFAPAPGVNNGADYAPEKLTRSTWFRRRIFSSPCQENISEAILITVEQLPAAPVAKNVILCHGGSATLTASAQLPAHTLEWYSEPAGGTPLYKGLNFITKPLTATTDFYVQAKNQAGCISERVKVTATVIEKRVDAGPDAIIVLGRTTQLYARGGQTYSWSPASTLSDPNIQNPVARPEETTTYTVTITTKEGCTYTDDVTITVLPKIHIPNALTLNGDGLNDLWVIKDIENYPNCHVQIFTRWGAKIFESVGYRTPWDGTHQGRELPMSAYYYIIKLNEKEDAITGSITLIK